MKKTNYLAFGFLAIIVLWMLSGVWASVPEQIADNSTVQTRHLMKVSVKNSVAQPVSKEIILQGKLEPIKQVVIRAKTASSVSTILLDKGRSVSAGDNLILLDLEDRQAQIESASAAVASAELELSAAKKLKRKGLQSDNLVKSAKSALAQAKANFARAKLELDNVRVEAPFKGTVESREVEIGSRIDVGEALMTLVDESVIKAVGYIPQQSVANLAVGQEIKITLLDGRQAKGKITFVARVGDSDTHSFRVEAEIPNSKGLLNAGTSAQLIITTGSELAHFLSPSTFALDDTGDVGVKTVDLSNQVNFHPVNIIRTEASGFWVTGLPEETQVITLGQGFVATGENVIPVPAS